VRRAAFYTRQANRNAELRAGDASAEISTARYTGRPTYIDQILTSLKTVFTGFLLATLIAVPIGVLCGLSRTASAAFNPFIQIFKPVSPLAWLPLVTMVVSALYVSAEPMFEKSFIVSAVTVALCSMWPTIINTTLGVSSIDKDLMNVSRVLKLGWPTQLFKIVLPSSLPLIFTGMRLSLGVGWMVLIAAEMLAQNPGLGKFVWDEFQNGSADSLARILVAVFTIGLIGFLLDRVMYVLQSLTNFSGRR
jgi:nitrate/nitrite transport system permease protein